MQKRVTIIGAGIAGLEAAALLHKQGVKVSVIEQNNLTGGNIRNWDRLFPNGREAKEVLNLVQSKVDKQIQIYTNTTVLSYNSNNDKHVLSLSTGENIETDAILISTGFQVFDASRKEEYGYGIYDNVLTSADLEKVMAAEKQVLTSKKEKINKIAFIHCVGSRDEKVGNTYCSKVCCVTAVKQAIEIKELYPDCEVYCLYMDLRMYDRYFEDMYRKAQEKFGITFIRGRLSEVAETFEGKLQIKTEDTLIGKPLKFTVDMLVLMAGMEPCKQSLELTSMFKLRSGDDGFFTPADEHLGFNLSNKKGIFLAGTCKGPKNIAETIADAHTAADAIYTFLNEKN